ncbi:MAG TPA: hypothetical protein VKA84_28195, partial [Gemmatimonadaceae bacterium]|nr:hypothetical protein [Gemmatimonadaceae bacterium]
MPVMPRRHDSSAATPAALALTLTLALALAACASSGSAAPAASAGQPAQGADAAAQSRDTGSTDLLVPPGYGTLRQDDIAIKF